MVISNVRASNFKSFADLNVDLSNLNVLIGSNAAGKSNFISLFAFLRDIADNGVSNAISMHGGADYLLNLNIGADQPLRVNVTFRQDLGTVIEKDKVLLGLRNKFSSYNFALKLHKSRYNYEIVSDSIDLEYGVYELFQNKPRGFKEKKLVGEVKLSIARIGKGFTITMDNPQNVPLTKEEIFPQFLVKRILDANELLLERSSFSYPLFERVFADVSIYDIDPRMCKMSSKITGKSHLEEDGSNISIVLNRILASKENKRKLSNLLRDTLPFVKNIDVERLSDKSLLFKLQEQYLSKDYLPASFLSDGTISITTIILALYFDERKFAIFEEPERNMHASLLPKLMQLFRDSSKEKQIMVTTHNPFLLKHTDLSAVKLVCRDSSGFSSVTSPVDNKNVKTFLKNDIGIDELLINNLLGD